MYEFTKIERIAANKKPVNERLENYEEIYDIMSDEEMPSQSSRCIQCGNPYCSSIGCPLGNNIPQWLKAGAGRKLELAFQLSNETSPYPEILGRICPHSSLCEQACTLNDGHGAVTIGNIEVAINEMGFEKGYSPNYHPLIDNKTVGIIGSGPAGLSIAHFLLKAGIKPVIYEKNDKAGGLLTYGIPGFKLSKAVVDRRINIMTDAGLKIFYNTEIGNTLTFSDIRNKHNATFIAIGATEGRVLDQEGYIEDSILMAVPFLTHVQKKHLGFSVDKKYNVESKDIIVIGGGDTAMDCVRTAVREKAKSVKCFYRRDEKQIPGSKKEFLLAKEEGVMFSFNKSPNGFITDANEDFKGVVFSDTKVTTSGDKLNLVVLEGTEKEYYCDVVILALGFHIKKLNFLTESNIELTPWGAIVTDDNLMTSLDGVYAGGDVSRGADLAVTAALDGREAANSIIKAIL